jgi:hypothetical protein
MKKTVRVGLSSPVWVPSVELPLDMFRQMRGCYQQDLMCQREQLNLSRSQICLRQEREH